MHVLMLFLFAFTIPPAAKVIAVAVVVYGVLQGLKKAPVFSTFLSGTWALVFNIAFSVLGVLVVAAPGTLYSVDTLNDIFMVIGTALAAAGIHGTTKTLAPAAPAPVVPATPPTP